MNTVKLVAPVKGKVIPLKEVTDQVFAKGMMGEGIAFIPEDGTIIAPCDGTIMMIAETLHAIGIQAENGAEILIHVGLDTVDLKGNGFRKVVEINQKVKQGDSILKFDMDYMNKKNINLTTPMVITNSTDYDVSLFSNSEDEIVMACTKKENVTVTATEKKGKYDTLAECITDLIGGRDNVTAFTHCVTRLRFTVKNKNAVKTSEIEEIENVVGCNWAGNQLQIIIGQSVGDAYQKICEVTDLGTGSTESVQEEKQKFSLSVVLDYITGSIAPVLPALIGCGMLKVLVLVLEMCGILTAGSGTDQMITFAADTTFYFLPVLVARGAAKKLNANESIAMVIGAMLVYPSFTAAVTEGTAMSFLGIPVYATTYTSTVFPALLSIAVMAPVQKFFAKHSPELLRTIVEPLCTLLVMIPVAYCILGPIGAFMGTYLSTFVIWLYNATGFFGVGLFAAVLPLVVMTGMHSAFTPYVMNMMATVGYEPIFAPAMVISNLCQGAACAAVAFKTKKTNLKATAMSCSLTAIVGGVTEPGLYGVTLKYKTPLISAMIGGFVGGCIAGIFHVYVRAFYGSAGIFAIPSFISDDIMTLVWFIISLIISMIATFVLTIILYKDEQ